MSEHDRAVSRLERELRFHPVGNPSPRTITAEQVARYNREGFLSGFRVFGVDEIAAHRMRFDGILAEFLRRGYDSYDIDRYHDRIAEIYDIARHPPILDIVEDLIGPDIVCWATHYFCKMPGDDKQVSWHQDCSYWALTPSKTVTVWLAIDDVDAENGCMHVIPGTHVLGHLAWRESGEGDRNVLTQAIDDAETLGSPVNVELPAGSISVHSDLLVHGSLPNRSMRRRCGLTLRYCPPDVRAYWDWNARSIICRGSDPSGHWKHIDRPEGPIERAFSPR